MHVCIHVQVLEDYVLAPDYSDYRLYHPANDRHKRRAKLSKQLGAEVADPNDMPRGYVKHTCKASLAQYYLAIQTVTLAMECHKSNDPLGYH